MTTHDIRQTLERLAQQVEVAKGMPLKDCTTIPYSDSRYGIYDFRVGDFLIKDLKRDDAGRSCGQRCGCKATTESVKP